MYKCWMKKKRKVERKNTIYIDSKYVTSQKKKRKRNKKMLKERKKKKNKKCGWKMRKMIIKVKITWEGKKKQEILQTINV